MAEKKPFENFVEFSSIGVEMAAAVIIGMLLGMWFDRYFKTSPWGIVVGTTLGVAAAVKKIIDIALAQEKKENEKKKGQ